MKMEKNDYDIEKIKKIIFLILCFIIIFKQSYYPYPVPIEIQIMLLYLLIFSGLIILMIIKLHLFMLPLQKNTRYKLENNVLMLNSTRIIFIFATYLLLFDPLLRHIVPFDQEVPFRNIIIPIYVDGEDLCHIFFALAFLFQMCVVSQQQQEKYFAGLPSWFQFTG